MIKDNTKLNLYLLLSALIIFCANIHFNMSNLIMPDGRWIITVPTTIGFIAIYLVLFILISKKILKNPKIYFFPVIFSTIISIIFLEYAPEIQPIFQDFDFLYIKHIVPIAPYLIFFGLSLLVYFILVKLLENYLKPSTKLEKIFDYAHENTRPAIKVALIASFVFIFLMFILPEIQGLLLPTLIIIGFFITFFIKQDRIYKFLLGNLIGSLFFGFLSMIIMPIGILMATCLLYFDTIYYNLAHSELWEVNIESFGWMCSLFAFVGGILGATCRGIITICKEKFSKSTV